MSDERIQVNCTAERLLPQLSTLNTISNQFLNAASTLEEKFHQLYLSVLEINKVVTHIHDSHLHWKSHAGEDKYDVGIGAAFMPPVTGPIDRLVAEFNNMTDMDGNGLIYGYDFLIDLYDSKYNLVLKELEQTMHPNRIPHIKRLSWDLFLETLPGKGKMEGYVNE